MVIILSTLLRYLVSVVNLPSIWHRLSHFCLSGQYFANHHISRWNQWLALTLVLPVVVFVAGLPASIAGTNAGQSISGTAAFTWLVDALDS